MDFKELELKPIETWTDEELKGAAQFGLPKNQSPEVIQGLYWLRLCGLDALKCSKKELRKVTEEDDTWWQKEKNKDSLYDSKMDRKILFEVGRKESLDYFRDCQKKEKQAIEAYIEEHKRFLATNYPVYISSWFSSWGDFQSEHDVEMGILDWSIFFSLLTPKPPWDPYAKIPRILERFFTIQRQYNKPLLLKRIWDTPELRAKVLAGEPLPYQWEVIVPYSTIYSYIRRGQDEEDRRKAIGKEIDIGRTKRYRELKPLFNQVLEAQEEGTEVVFTRK